MARGLKARDSRGSWKVWSLMSDVPEGYKAQGT
jgi:hypothetical protein